MHTPQLPGIWLGDYSGGLVPKVKSALASWSTTGGVTWNGQSVQLVGSSQSMQAAFTPPAENYVVELEAYFPASSGTLTIELLSGISGTSRFAYAVGGADTLAINAGDATPVNFEAGQWNLYRFVVRPSMPDVIAFSHYYDPLFQYLVRDLRLDVSGTKEWATSGAIGALRISSSSGTVYVRQVSVMPVIGVIIGDSIATGSGAGKVPIQAASGYSPAPVFLGARSGRTHTMKWYLEREIDPTFGSMILSMGKGGYGLEEVDDLMQEYVVDVLDGMSDKLMIGHMGTNDVNNGATDGVALALLDSIIAQANAASIKMLIGHILPRTPFNSTKDAYAIAFNAALAARTTANIKMMDYLADTPSLLKSGTVFDLNPLNSEDGTHPDWNTYGLLGSTLVNAYNTL